jgi:hypothetical protein
MEKISQRTSEDCLICVLAMVMGPPYTYERVLEDSKKYRRAGDEGLTMARSKDYLNNEGFEVENRPLSDLRTFSDLASLPSNSRAMLFFRTRPKIGHVVAIDQDGVIDPEDHPAEYKSIRDFREIFGIEGWQLYAPRFLLVRKRSRV